MTRTGTGFERCWDAEWEPVSGCSPISDGCRDCYAQQLAGTLHQRAGILGVVRELYAGITTMVRGEPVFNSVLRVLPAGHPGWSWPLRWSGAKHPVLGEGRPSLLFVGSMAELFHEGRSTTKIIDPVIGTVAVSDHIGLLVNKRAHLMAAYFAKQSVQTRQRWKQKFWPGFSAESQKWFNRRWRSMRPLAAEGWTIPVFLAPMIGPVRLPADYLALGNRGWVVVGGEQKTRKLRAPRPLKPDWAGAVRDQCLTANVPFFLLHMSHGHSIPADLKVRQFPDWPRRDGGIFPTLSASSENAAAIIEQQEWRTTNEQIPIRAPWLGQVKGVHGG